MEVLCSQLKAMALNMKKTIKSYDNERLICIICENLFVKIIYLITLLVEVESIALF